MDREKLMKKARAARTGGKGTARRKKAGPTREINREEQRFHEKLENFYRSLAWRQVDGVKEAIFMVGTDVMMFPSPSVAACKTQNIWVVSGKPIVEDIAVLFTSLLNQVAAQGDDMKEDSNDGGDDKERGYNDEGEEGAGAEAEDEFPSTSYS